jgi:3-mercaptopyruvate sulfurtransferase SseA
MQQVTRVVWLYCHLVPCLGCLCTLFFLCRVAVLEGGFPAWVAAKGAVTTESITDEEVNVASEAAATAVAAAFPAKLDQNLVKSMAQVREALNTEVQILDARSSGRFKGIAPEPRPELPSGAMPGGLPPIPIATAVPEEELGSSYGKDVASVRTQSCA